MKYVLGSGLFVGPGLCGLLDRGVSQVLGYLQVPVSSQCITVVSFPQQNLSKALGSLQAPVSFQSSRRLKNTSKPWGCHPVDYEKYQ